MNQTEKEASFTVKRTAFMKTLKQLKMNVVNKKYREKCICEITIIDGFVSMNVPGATFGLEAKTMGSAKTSTELEMLTEVVKSHKVKELKVTIQPSRIMMESSSWRASTTFFEDDKILRSTILPVNFDDIDLLAISASKKYTVEELQFNNLWVPVNQAEGRLRNNINDAIRRLKVYGITKEEVEELVKKRIELRVQSLGRSYNVQEVIQNVKGSKIIGSRWTT